MPKRFDTVLVEVAAPGDDEHPALAAAEQCLSGERVCFELFHNLYHKALMDRDPADAVMAEARELLLGERRAQLGKLVARLGADGIRADANLCWAPDGWSELTRLAEQKRADVIVRPVQRRSRWERWTLGNADWQLVRYSPCPVLLVKKRRAAPYRKALVAIDPLHADDKPASLDHEILNVASSVTTKRCEVSVINVVVPTAMPVSAMVEPGIVPSRESQEPLCQAHRKQVNALIHQHGLDQALVHVVVGDPVGEIVALANHQQIDLLIMGAVSRSALGRLLIGSTAERVLDLVDCDLLIVKPPAAAARAERPARQQGAGT